MSEYIERGALLGEIRKHFETIGANAERLVTRFPTADVEPVVRGEWVSIPSSDLSTGCAYECSVCKKMRYGSYMPNYCQCCGAKMAHMERSGSGER